MKINRQDNSIICLLIQVAFIHTKLDEVRGAAIKDNNSVRYQTNIKSLLNMIVHIYDKTKDTFNNKKIEGK